jgi:magnesium transporter
MIDVYPPHPAGQAAPHPGAVWLDLTAPLATEIRLVEDLVGLQLPSRADLAEIEQSSQLSFENGVLQLAAPVIVNADTDHPNLGHIGLVLTPKLLISVHDEPLRMIQFVAENAPKKPTPSSSVTLFAALLEAYVARQADLLEEARARLDAISHRVFRNAAENPKRATRSNVFMRDKLQTLGRLGERTSMIRESLLAVERMIPFALESAGDWFAPELAKRLQVVRGDIGSLSQFEEHLLGKVQFLLDAVLGFIGIEQNDIFKVLTIASVVGIFPTLVAGWYGMNFHNMPEYGWAYGYQFGIGVVVVSTILPLLWFKWRGWL